LLAGGYSGYREGNFLSLIRVIERDIDRHFEVFGTDNAQVLTAHLDKDQIKTGLARVIAQAAAAAQRGPIWLDKTGNPDMIEAIPRLVDIWTSSHFVFAKRRAIENIVSRLRKFPRHTFEYHCADWAKNMTAWQALRRQRPDLPAIEVDQYDIGHAPEETAGRIAAFLGIPAEGEAKMSAAFTRQRPQQTEAGSAERTLSLAETGWNEQQLQCFHRNCDAQMAAFGYTEDERYRTSGAQPGIGVREQSPAGGD
jgi:hypothetical protein